MLFHSLTFASFFGVFYILYLALQHRLRWQNLLLLAASYVFYGYWDVRFLSLILLSTVVDYTVGLRIARLASDDPAQQRQRKRWLMVSLATNLGILGFFKYFGFFTTSLTDALHVFGLALDPITLNVVLPVGISFYTFQTLSYTIDIYRDKLEPTRDFVNFAAFVAFFPQLVAGPIERASNLLPQISTPRRLDPTAINAGIFLFVWGLFKKIYVADRCALIANQVFNQHTNYGGADLLIGVLAFTFQIYGDFSGYTDMARGVARLLGFELMVNFRLPYFALNPSDFWNRWHISLSSWLRDYLYIPLGGNRHGLLMTYRNLMITMTLGGLWHGAAMTFVLWGIYHGLILILYRMTGRQQIHKDPWGGQYRRVTVLGRMALMFGLTMFGWLLFRAESVEQVAYFIRYASLATSVETATLLGSVVAAITPLILVQIWQYHTRNLLIPLRLSPAWQGVLYGVLFIWLLLYSVREPVEFIYFQF